MLQLYYSPGACSLAVHIALAASGAEYELVDSRIIDGKTRTAEFLRLNDRARVPVLVREGQAFREAVAILIGLDEWFPRAGLMPPADSIERQYCLEWLSFFTSTFHPLYWGVWRKHRLVSDESHHADLDATSRLQLLKAYTQTEEQLQDRHYLLGDKPYACDYYAYVFVRWAYRIFDQIPQFPRLEAYNEQLSGLPVVQKALTAEGLKPLT